jgi:hypothetical protein
MQLIFKKIETYQIKLDANERVKSSRYIERVEGKKRRILCKTELHSVSTELRETDVGKL